MFDDPFDFRFAGVLERADPPVFEPIALRGVPEFFRLFRIAQTIDPFGQISGLSGKRLGFRRSDTCRMLADPEDLFDLRCAVVQIFAKRRHVPGLDPDRREERRSAQGVVENSGLEKFGVEGPHFEGGSVFG